MRTVEQPGRSHPLPPRGGCYWIAGYPQYWPHGLNWAGWYQSGNTEVVMPGWRCVCGMRTLGVAEPVEREVVR